MPSPLPSFFVWSYAATLGSLRVSCGAVATHAIPLVIVREINCDRAVNYSPWVLKCVEHMLVSAHHTFIGGQSVPIDPLSVKTEKPQRGTINGTDRIKRLFRVRRDREKMDIKVWKSCTKRSSWYNNIMDEACCNGRHIFLINSIYSF